MSDKEVLRLTAGQVRMWIEQEVIHLMAGHPPSGDPTELTPEAARAVARALLEMADKISD
jgi:hypothetical protein